MTKMHMLDVVTLLKDIASASLERGNVGTIVERSNPRRGLSSSPNITQPVSPSR
jgi:hypothetical protein